MTQFPHQDATIALLEESGALRSGHFLLSSGLHSDRYCQCAALFEQAGKAERAAAMMAEMLAGHVKFDTVLAPALGGILWGYELARCMGARSLFAERKPGEGFSLRRGFQLQPDERVLLAEDVVTTGKSVMELVPLVERLGGRVAGFAAVADRSGGTFAPASPFLALARLEFAVWNPQECPLCRAGGTPEKPGSRELGA